MDIGGLLTKLEALQLKRVVNIIKGIRDEKLQQATATLLQRSIAARESLENIDLKTFEAAEYDLTGVQVWQNVSQHVYASFMKVAQLIAVINEIAPSTDDTEIDDDALDMAFAELDGDFTPGEWKPPEENRGQEIDDLLEQMLGEGSSPDNENEERFKHLGDIAWSVSGILKSEISQFNKRISLEAVVTDRWNLLGEITETKHRLSKGLGALVAGICSVYEPVRKEDVVPGYKTQLSASLFLRNHFRELRLEVQGYSDQLKELPKEEWPSLAEKVYHKIDETIFGEPFEWMRPLDKRVLIELRKRFKDAFAQETIRPRQLYEIVEDSLRFLEAMNIINSREILVEHDQSACNMALLYLEAAAQTGPELGAGSLKAAVAALASAKGRDPELDIYIDKLQVDQNAVPMEELMSCVHRVLVGLNR